MASPHTSANELRDRALLLAKELGVDPDAWYVRVLEEERRRASSPISGRSCERTGSFNASPGVPISGTPGASLADQLWSGEAA